MTEESPKMKAENPKRALQVVGLRTKESERIRMMIGSEEVMMS